MTSQTLRRYQLEHKHFLTATISHGDTKAVFKYAVVASKSTRTQLLHGFMASDNNAEIESVDIAFIHNSDVVELSDGKKYTVMSYDEKPIDENQLRWVPWEKADKVFRITLKSVG